MVVLAVCGAHFEMRIPPPTGLERYSNERHLLRRSNQASQTDFLFVSLFIFLTSLSVQQLTLMQYF